MSHMEKNYADMLLQDTRQLFAWDEFAILETLRTHYLNEDSRILGMDELLNLAIKLYFYDMMAFANSPHEFEDKLAVLRHCSYHEFTHLVNWAKSFIVTLKDERDIHPDEDLSLFFEESRDSAVGDVLALEKFVLDFEQRNQEMNMKGDVK